MKYLKALWRKLTPQVEVHSGVTIKYMFPLVFGFLTVLSASVVSTDKSYVRLEPSQTAVMQGERFSIDVYASAHVPVNAIDITIDFSPEKVEIISVDKAQSVLTVWTQEPIVEGSTITFGGGTFRRGFLGEHLVATIKAQAKVNGVTEFLVSNAQLLAGDGKGTPVAVSGTGNESKQSFYIYDQDEDPTAISASLGVNITADINGDGVVTLKDISAFMVAWNTKSQIHDFNSDGKMNFIDFSIILAKSFFGA